MVTSEGSDTRGDGAGELLSGGKPLWLLDVCAERRAVL